MAQLSVAFPDIAVLTLQVVCRHCLRLTLNKTRSSLEAPRRCPADTWILFVVPPSSAWVISTGGRDDHVEGSRGWHSWLKRPSQIRGPGPLASKATSIKTLTGRLPPASTWTSPLASSFPEWCCVLHTCQGLETSLIGVALATHGQDRLQGSCPYLRIWCGWPWTTMWLQPRSSLHIMCAERPAPRVHRPCKHYQRRPRSCQRHKRATPPRSFSRQNPNPICPEDTLARHIPGILTHSARGGRDTTFHPVYRSHG